MTNETKHTPTPWKIVVAPSGTPDITDANGDLVVAALGFNAIEKTAHIVKCVNMHDELVDCCNKIINNWGNLHHKDLMQLRAAVEKAGAL